MNDESPVGKVRFPAVSSILEEFVSALPAVSSPPPLDPACPVGIAYVSQRRPTFVEPTLALTGDRPADQAQAVVVAAPAAVGKTMLAEEIAHRTGGILWNLAGFHVGDHFSIGTLAKSHGPANLSQVLNQLASGAFLIVADAIDEARLRVPFDGFTAFLDDLAAQVAAVAPRGKPSIVLLARRETAEFTADWLSDSSIAVAQYSIEFFDEKRALEFIDKQLASPRRVPAPGPLIEARNAMVRQVLKVLGAEDKGWEHEAVRRFLGYAPVLVAISRYLADDGNPYALAQELRADETPDAIWRFLVSLLDGILLREQEKFVNGFKEKVAAKAGGTGFEDWGSLFTREEQCSWLVNLGRSGATPKVRISRDLEDDYRSAVRDWLTNHPFIGASPTEFAGPVFEETSMHRRSRVEKTITVASLARAWLNSRTAQPKCWRGSHSRWVVMGCRLR